MKAHRISFLILGSLISLSLIASAYPPEVETILQKAGANRKELEKAIVYFQNDKQKLEAVFFLLRNMDIHYSEYVQWKTPEGKVLSFDEFKYPTYKEAVKAFNTNYRSAKASRQKTEDIYEVEADFLINAIEEAFNKWNTPVAAHLSFDDFCEYLLPYRSMSEKLDPNWRKKYKNHFDHSFQRLKDPLILANAVSLYLDKTFFSTYAIDPNIYDILLSPSQVLFRKQGGCEDLANYCLFILRSQGVATSFDYVPAWATSTGRHIWNTIIDKQGRKVSFTAGEKKIGNFKLKREPGKVVRFTYSKQKNTVASQLSLEKIPNSYMRSSNYIDVTDDYWKCHDIPSDLFPSTQEYVYISVFNGMQWQPIYFGAVKNNKTVFKKMACGAIYLPMYYENDELKNASYPILLDKEGKINYLKTDRNNNINITIPEKDRYLIYRANKTYKLYYWDEKWVHCGSKQIQSKRELTFSNIPSNTLYILVPEYSKGKERPFTVHSDGTLFYW